MKRLIYLIALGMATLTLQGCGNNGGTTGTSCSCAPRIGHEARHMNLNFKGSDITAVLKIIGYYGIEGADGGCCNPYGEGELTGRSNSLDLERVNTNRLAVYSSQTYVVFDGVFLPNAWTLQLWINPSTNNSLSIIMDENIDNQKALFLSLTDDKKLSLNLPPSDNSMSTTHLNIESSSALTADTWQHIAVTVSGNDVDFYVNGVSEKRQSFDSDVYNHLESRSSFSLEGKRLCFGSCQLSTGDMSFQGKVDNIEFVNRVLSPAEILSHYQSSESNFQ